ncbi:PIN domain-containing protein [Aquimarina sp. RZ0]|uniref:PIN domain-containing protein n=1 Tax=Aquimarina sp. RZ0 TaxID=2607730 RepID=UPI0011F22A9C|nr:PIN domain-containing protein [Aquimarina sp. RZ0]KAA1247703.1 PIN domain-containing protein [Aquimarina sp. RZ0]
MKRKGVSEGEIRESDDKTNKAFRGVLVHNNTSRVDGLSLSDPKGIHMLAVVVKTNITVTNNLKDFPRECLQYFGLITKGTSCFLADIIDLYSKNTIKAFKELVVNRRNPDLDGNKVLGILRKQSLKNTVDCLHSLF